MRKVSLIGNSLAYCLNQERQRATDYRPGMTPEDVRVVFTGSKLTVRPCLDSSAAKLTPPV